MKLHCAMLSCVGNREINEDYIKIVEKDDAVLVVVADGLGGHDKGEVASKTVAEVIANEVTFQQEDMQGEVENALRKAQEKLLEKQKEENAVNAMKTTVVVLAIKKQYAILAHVGDSRGYAFLKNRKYIRTIDHSVPQMLALVGDIKEKNIRNHPDRSSLLRVFGTPWEKDAFEVSECIDLKSVNAFLLATDGFWELINEREMRRCLRWSKTPDEWLNKMRSIVEKRGKNTSMDNYTAGVVLIKEE